MGVRVNNQSGGDFESPEPGSYLARCYRVVSLGIQRVVWKDKAKLQEKVMLSWELIGTKMSDERPYTVHQTLTASLNEKAKLRLWLEAWRARPFTPEELADFDLDNILNAPCQLNLAKVTKGERTFINITTVMAVLPGTEVDELVNAPVSFNLAEPDWDVFESLSDRLQERIKGAENFSRDPEPAHVTDEEIAAGAWKDADGNDEKVPF